MKIKSKLQSKRGVSIMLALLLLLVCLLAGVAALTASAANVGRHSYMRDTQQQYLAVSSAARLIKDQLDGLEIRGTYIFTATDWDKARYDPLTGLLSGDYHITDGEVDTPDFTYYLDGDAGYPADTILNFFKGEAGLEGMIARAAKARISQKIGPWDVPWEKCIIIPTTEVVDTYDFEIECEGIDANAQVHLEISDANDLGSYSNDKEFTVTVTCDGYEYVIEMTGKIEFIVPTPTISASEQVPLSLDPLNPDAVIYYQKIDECSQLSETIVKFTMDDSYVRKVKP